MEEDHNSGLWISEGWLNTGDLGRCDESGYFWLTGRKKELIIRGGHNIDPASVEEPIYKLEGVQMVACVGRPDPHAGEVPVAYVQLQDRAALSEDEIMEHARRTIGERAAVPKEIHIIDQMPLTPVGKIFKPALRWDATKRAYEEALVGLGEMASSVAVSVAEHKLYGTEVAVEVYPAPDVTEDKIKAAISALLSRYTVHYRVVVPKG